MAIGALIGGLVQRAGDKSYEKQQQDRNEALYRQKLQADYLIDDLKTNWDYLDEAGRASRYGLLEPLLGMKKGELGNMATFGEQVYKILPPFQSGGVQSAQRQSLDQLPTPGETGAGSAAIMAPHTIPTPPARDRSLMMSQVPAVRKIQIGQQAKMQASSDERQQHITDIMNSSMSDADKAMAIRAMDIPTPILAAQEREAGGSGSPMVGLGVVELVSPDGKQRILAQSTRTGHLVETGTGRVLSPEIMAGWTKRHVFSPQAFINQGGTLDVLNKEELARRMNADSSIAGTIPDIRPAEPRQFLTDANQRVVAVGGTRSGTVTPVQGVGQGTAVGTDIYKSGLPTGEKNTRTYIENATRNIGVIQEISKRRPDLIGPIDYVKNAGMRAIGQQSDEDANNLYNALDRFREDAARVREGAVLPPAMLARLERILATKAWYSEAQFQDDMRNAAEIMEFARQERGLPSLPSQATTPRSQAPNPSDARGGMQRRATSPSSDPTMGGEVTVTAPNGKTYVFPNQQEANKFKQAAGIK